MWLKAFHLLNIEEGLTTWTFNRLCESSEGEADRLFANMSALVFISHQEDVNLAQYTFYHKSFQDFLCQPSRYGKYLTISEEESHEWLVELFLQIFEGVYAFHTFKGTNTHATMHAHRETTGWPTHSTAQ
jgi:hypothetical protein